MGSNQTAHRFAADHMKLGRGAVVTAAVYGVAVMVLWNWLMPALFELPQLNFGQALGLLLLSRILFGGLFGRFRRMGSRHRRMRKKDDPTSASG